MSHAQSNNCTDLYVRSVLLVFGCIAGATRNAPRPETVLALVFLYDLCR